MKKILFSLIALSLLFVSCGDKKKASDDLADTGRTKRTEALLSNLDSIAGVGFLVGQQDATLYGVGWEGDSARSDIKTISSESPAVVGFELGGIEKGDSVNIHGTSFDVIRKAILAQYDCGGVCLLSWHVAKMPSEEQILRVCDFLNTLEEPYGVRVPVILRPCVEDLNTDFMKRLKNCIKEKDVVNALLAYTETERSINTINDAITAEQAKEFYSMFDIFGFSLLDPSESADGNDHFYYKDALEPFFNKMAFLSEEYHKPFGIFVTGSKGIPSNKWFTEVLLPVIEKRKFSFLLFERNDNKLPGHFFVPFPGHPATSDFAQFVNHPKTLFLREANGLYLTRE